MYKYSVYVCIYMHAYICSSLYMYYMHTQSHICMHYVCIFVYKCIWIYTCEHTCTYSLCTCFINICMCIYIYVSCTCPCTHTKLVKLLYYPHTHKGYSDEDVLVHVCVYTYICIHAYLVMYIMCIYIIIYICTYTHTHLTPSNGFNTRTLHTRLTCLSSLTLLVEEGRRLGDASESCVESSVEDLFWEFSTSIYLTFKPKP